MEAKRFHIGEIGEYTGKILSTLHDAELRALFDSIHVVRARIRQGDDVCFGSLGLQQER